MKGHPVAYSRKRDHRVNGASYTNFGGKVHGGTLMSLMDKLLTSVPVSTQAIIVSRFQSITCSFSVLLKWRGYR